MPVHAPPSAMAQTSSRMTAGGAVPFGQPNALTGGVDGRRFWNLVLGPSPCWNRFWNLSHPDAVFGNQDGQRDHSILVHPGTERPSTRSQLPRGSAYSPRSAARSRLGMVWSAAQEMFEAFLRQRGKEFDTLTPAFGGGQIESHLAAVLRST